MTNARGVAKTALAVLGVRELDSGSFDVLRVRTLPAVLSLLASVPDVGIRFEYEADPDGLVAVRVVMHGPDGSVLGEVGDAVARLLSPLVEVGAVSAADLRRHSEPAWTLARALKSAPPGFGSVRDASPVSVVADGFPYAAVQDLLDALVHAPGHLVVAELSARSQGSRQPLCDFEVQVGVCSAEGRNLGQGPPVAITAILNRLVPGCVLAAGAQRLLLTFADASGLPLIPSSSGQPLPGLAVASAAPVPIRHRPGLGQPEDGLQLGSVTLHSGKHLRASLTAEEQVRHIHITGRTGTGKSTLLATIARSVAERGRGLLVLDPHGTLIDRIAAELPPQALARTFLIRAGNVANPVPLNPLATDDPVVRDLAIADILAGFYVMFDPGRTGIVGPRFESTVGMCLRTLAAFKGNRASVLDVPRLLTDTSFQRRARAAVNDPAVLGFWTNHDLSTRSNEHGELIAWITSKWERFSSTAALRAILGTGQDTLDLDAAMEHGHIVLLDLSKGAIGGPAAELLGFLYTTRAWTAALNRRHTAPYTVMVDEAHSFMAGALPAMLSEGRKYGISVVLAHQYLGQLPAELSQALAGNTGTQIAFRAGRADAEALHHRMGRMQPPEAYTTLADLCALVQRTAGPTTAHPHTLMVSHLHNAPADAAQQLSRLEETTRGLLSPDPANDGDDPADNHGGDKPPQTQDPQRPHPGARRPAPRPDKSKSFLDAWLEQRAQQHPTTEPSNRPNTGGDSTDMP